jgi:hypothetical protein
MDIKPVNTGNVNRNSSPEEPTPATKPPKGSAPASETPAQPAQAGPLDPVRTEFGRPDLFTDRKDLLLQRTADSLVCAAGESLGPIPEGAREKIAGMLSSDPLISSRILNYWNNNLS